MRNTIYTLMLIAMIESSCLDYANVSLLQSLLWDATAVKN